MALAREAESSIGAAQVEAAWPQAEQRERCLAGLEADGLLTQVTPGRWALPGVITAVGRGRAALRLRHLDTSVGPSVSSGPRTGVPSASTVSSGGMSGTVEFFWPRKVNFAAGPSPSTSTSTI